MSGAGKEHYQFIWLVLVFASAGVLSHSGIKVPFFAFFHHDSGKRPREAPLNMLIAMGLTAFLCVYIGINPGHLYSLLPYEVKYNPYTLEHILTQLQLLCFAILAFYVLYKLKQLPSEERGVTLDFDWTYRKLLPSVINMFVRVLSRLQLEILRLFKAFIETFISGVFRLSGPDSITTRLWTSGTMVLCIAIVLLVVLGIILI